MKGTAAPGGLARRRWSDGAQTEGLPAPQRRYLALYEIEGEPGDAIKILLERLHGGDIVLPPSMNVDSIQAWCYRTISDRVTAVSL
jgi:hypothetical protein